VRFFHLIKELCRKNEHIQKRKNNKQRH